MEATPKYTVSAQKGIPASLAERISAIHASALVQSWKQNVEQKPCTRDDRPVLPMAREREPARLQQTRAKINLERRR